MPMLEVDQGQIFYEISDRTCPWVENPQTVILHHGIGATGRLWTEWLPYLIDRYRIVCFDMRGLGRSSHPGENYKWTLDSLVEDVFAVADAVGAERFHLLGESIGGTIALRAAIREKSRFLSLTVSNGAHVGSSIKNVDAWRRIIESDGMVAWSRHMMALRFFEERPIGDKRRWYEEEQANNNGNSILNALSVLIGTDLSDELSSLKLPILLMHPDSSPFIPVSTMANLYELLPDSEIQIFSHARHGLPFSHARECASVYRYFLERHFEH